MDFDSKQRRNQDILQTSGYGLLVLNLWTLVKTIIYYLCAPDVVYEVCFSLYGDEMFKTGVRIAAAVMLAVDFIIQMYVGLTAIKVGKSGRRGGSLFIVFAVVLSLLSILYVVEDILYVLSMPLAIFALIVDLFILFVQVEIVVCGIKNKHYKRLSKGGKK